MKSFPSHFVLFVSNLLSFQRPIYTCMNTTKLASTRLRNLNVCLDDSKTIPSPIQATADEI